MANRDKQFLDNGVPAVPLESFPPHGILASAYKPRQLDIHGSPLAEIPVTTYGSTWEHGYQAKLEKNQKKTHERKGIKKMIKRTVCGLKTWLSKQSLCGKRGEEKGPGARAVGLDLGDRDDSRGIVWIDEGTRSQASFMEEKRGCRNSGHTEAIITVREVSGT
ncbi:uncharacterized protein H6S33_001485 [Morchella sextelata]|uniref:uncharacterized protein n=1 Tax=Morchella sextelata TaxID=1174677 RepID=UPI001D0375E0|nr:uncharacterized protein H6S33_001485 [Morchella sextelata]KAH0608351.1 hypothetical protein H6S33_001485 [Morchella sextelata]